MAHKKILPGKFTADDRAGTVVGRDGARSKIRMNECSIRRPELRMCSDVSDERDSMEARCQPQPIGSVRNASGYGLDGQAQGKGSFRRG